MKCQRCGMFQAVCESTIENRKRKYCMECYRRMLAFNITLQTKKEAVLDKCNNCGVTNSECKECHRPVIVQLTFGYNSGKLGVYCNKCLESVGWGLPVLI